MSTVSSGSSGRAHDPEDNRGAFGSAGEDPTAERTAPAADHEQTRRHDVARDESGHTTERAGTETEERRHPVAGDERDREFSERESRRETGRRDVSSEERRRTPAQHEKLRARTELELLRSLNRRTTDVGLFLLRLIPLLLIPHGITQVRNFSTFTQMVGQTQLGAMAPQVFAGLVVAAHIGLPVLIALGILTRFSSLLNTIALAMIWVFAHAVTGVMDAKTGGVSGEAAVLYALITIPLIFTGAGRFSIDHLTGRHSAHERAERRALKRL